ncbi:CobW family GTP-binding protein [Halomonas sp. M4R1S46]|uniref:CobW family GTP-binding protein n=1 Tax=Halomonas sp. M4R1S46 TaxID=2982692 RepID=UPI0021E40951|nr:GTP-binding protein [Halomonas sp. M4R1S46]UYG05996.1 GTP-binding protein [Halomonas sp. M4R1S46]
MPTPLTDIPVHVVTGFLGGGKSSLIRHWLAGKPAGERWAVLINEFGRVGIDQALLAGRDDVVVKALPGGCLCCQLAVVLKATLVELLRRERPDRLIIEPSGLGHPGGLLEMLRGEAFAEVLRLQEVIAVLDPRRLDDPRARHHETFRDQLALADGVALTMTDLASAAQVAAARRWIAELDGAVAWVEEAPHGRLPDAHRPASAGRHAAGMAYRPAAHRALLEAPVGAGDSERTPTPGVPVRETGRALGHVSLGWRWHAEEVFSRQALEACLAALPAGVRVKGVFHAADGWWSYNRVEGDEPAVRSDWRRDSRLELIGAPGTLPEAEALEAELAACLR